jgi:L-malate glycosyltransferase
MILVIIGDGRSLHAQRWSEYFAERGHEVHFITYDPPNRKMPGVAVHVVASRWNNLYLSFIPRHLAIKRLVKEIRPDLVHAHFIAKFGFHLPDLKFRPSVVSAWGDDILILPHRSRLLFWYTKKVLEYVDLVYAVSRNLRDHIVGDFGIRGTKVRHLPFGIDTTQFSPRKEAVARDTIEVFSNRNFYPVYDTETLVRGFALAYREEPALRLSFKGLGPEEEKIRSLVTELGLDGQIAFRKKSRYADVPEDYRNADIFLTTSLSDGTPVSILEAMASGLPCIATAVGGIPEWIENNVTGILIRPGAPEQVAEAILTLARDPVLRKRLGTAARDVIVRNGEWSSLMAQAEKDYLALIETYKQDRP